MRRSGIGDEGALRREFAVYLTDERELSPATAWTYNQALLRLEKFCGKPICEITATDVRAFMRFSAYHASTKNATVVAIKSFHRWGVLEGYWTTNGIVGLQGPRQHLNPKPSLTVSEVLALLGVTKRPNETRLVYLGLYAGCRVSESASIGPDEWLEDRLRFVGKGSKVREVPVHPDLEARRETILSNRPTRDTLKTTCRALAFLLGIPFTSHSLRRTFASTLSESGVPREVIGALLGHAPASVTEFYAPVRWSEKTEAMARLEFPT